MIHEEIVVGLSQRNPERVDAAMVRHGEVLITYLEAQMKAEASRMGMVRRIRKDSLPPPVGSRRRSQTK